MAEELLCREIDVDHKARIKRLHVHGIDSSQELLLQGFIHSEVFYPHTKELLVLVDKIVNHRSYVTAWDDDI